MTTDGEWAMNQCARTQWTYHLIADGEWAMDQCTRTQ
jgi:hypothetical protein